MADPQVYTPPAEPIHEHFGLSYASYLVLPRTLLQSMPVEWQQRFCQLLENARETCEQHSIEWPHSPELDIHVELIPADKPRGPRITDPLADYQRGRRRLWKNEPDPPTFEPGQAVIVKLPEGELFGTFKQHGTPGRGLIEIGISAPGQDDRKMDFWFDLHAVSPSRG